MGNKATTKKEIIKRIVNERNKLASFGVASIGLFGSFARGEQTPSSDIDILVEFEPEKHTFDNFMEVSFLFEDLLGRKVEVVTQKASARISDHIF